MDLEKQPSSKKRNRRRSFACSDELWEKIELLCKDKISNSSFIRNSIIKELTKRSIKR